MKKIIAIALAAVMALSMTACGSNNEEEVVERVAVRTETVEFLDGTIEEISYDANDTKMHSERIGESGVKTFAFDFDESGVTTAMYTYNDLGELAIINEYTYENGQKKTSTLKDPDGEVTSVYHYEYYESGNLHKETVKDAQERVVMVTEYYDGAYTTKSVTIYDAESAEVIMFEEYDMMGNSMKPEVAEENPVEPVE